MARQWYLRRQFSVTMIVLTHIGFIVKATPRGVRQRLGILSWSIRLKIVPKKGGCDLALITVGDDIREGLDDEAQRNRTRDPSVFTWLVSYACNIGFYDESVLIHVKDLYFEAVDSANAKKLRMVVETDSAESSRLVWQSMWIIEAPDEPYGDDIEGTVI